MLILSRKIGETLCIGDNITVTVMDISSNQVKIGISAPKSTSIMREELILGEDSLSEKSAPKDVNYNR